MRPEVIEYAVGVEHLGDNESLDSNLISEELFILLEDKTQQPHANAIVNL